MINVIFLGPPGSGKGTQAVILAAELKIPTISTGEVLRKEVELQSEIGKLAKISKDTLIVEGQPAESGNAGSSSYSDPNQDKNNKKKTKEK